MTIQNTQGSNANLGGGANVGALPNVPVISILQLVEMYNSKYNTAARIFGQREYGYTPEQIVHNSRQFMALFWPQFITDMQAVFGLNLGGLTLGHENANVGNVQQRGAA